VTFDVDQTVEADLYHRPIELVVMESLIIGQSTAPIDRPFVSSFLFFLSLSFFFLRKDV